MTYNKVESVIYIFHCFGKSAIHTQSYHVVQVTEVKLHVSVEDIAYK